MTPNRAEPAANAAGRRADPSDRHAAQTRLSYVEQAVADLRYYLLDGRLAPDRFPVLAERRLALTWAAVTLRIVGASHVCEIVAPGGACTEALVCAPLRPGDPVPLCAVPAGETRVVSARGGAAQVEARLERHPLTPADRHRLLAAGPAVMLAEYPGAGALAGLTRLEWRVASAGFALVTYHTYPADGALVVTRTHFTPLRTPPGPRDPASPPEPPGA